MPRVLEDRPAHVIDVEGVLDVSTAARLRDTILGFDAGDSVVIDCHEVRELQDSALAFLARSVFSLGRRVELRGLGEHHLRLLRYLGVGQTDASGGDGGRVA
jgi:anti-anti-sigma regulatory factor